MAESRYQHTVDGQEVQEDDLNNMSDNAGLADDHVLVELIRVPPFVTAPYAYVLPYGFDGASVEHNTIRPTVESSGSADGQVRVNPCRVGLGSLDEAAVIGGPNNLHDGRSALIVGTATLEQLVQLSDTASNNRVDLICVKVEPDIDDAPVDRFVKTPTNTSTQSLSTTKSTKATIIVVEGSEGATPARPALPADGGGAYYVRLAYVFLMHPFDGSTQVSNKSIHEAMRVRPINRALGVSHIAPASGLWMPEGEPLQNLDFDVTGRPPAHLPPTMTGGAERLFVYEANAFPSGETVLDTTEDWRKRVFRWEAMATVSGLFAWDDGGVTDDRVPSIYNNASANFGADYAIGFGQSFSDDGTAAAGIAGGVVCAVTNAANLSAMQAGSTIFLVARESDGALVMKVSATAPNVKIFFWLHASGTYGNA